MRAFMVDNLTIQQLDARAGASSQPWVVRDINDRFPLRRQTRQRIEQAWDARREQWLMSGEIVRTLNVTSTAECGEDGRWTTVVSAVAFCG